VFHKLQPNDLNGLLCGECVAATCPTGLLDTHPAGAPHILLGSIWWCRHKRRQVCSGSLVTSTWWWALLVSQTLGLCVLESRDLLPSLTDFSEAIKNFVKGESGEWSFSVRDVNPSLKEAKNLIKLVLFWRKTIENLGSNRGTAPQGNPLQKGLQHNTCFSRRARYCTKRGSALVYVYPTRTIHWRTSNILLLVFELRVELGVSEAPWWGY